MKIWLQTNPGIKTKHIQDKLRTMGTTEIQQEENTGGKQSLQRSTKLVYFEQTSLLTCVNLCLGAAEKENVKKELESPGFTNFSSILRSGLFMLHLGCSEANLSLL